MQREIERAAQDGVHRHGDASETSLRLEYCKSTAFPALVLLHHCRSYIDEDDDSGADSLGNDFSSSGGNNGSGNGHGRCNCASCSHNGHHSHHRASPASMALVPYGDPQTATGGCDSCGFYR